MPVEVVVVVVRDEDDVDRRELFYGYRGFHDPTRPEPLHRERSLTEHGVREHVRGPELQQHRRVTDPGCRVMRPARMRSNDGWGRGWKGVRRRYRRSPPIVLEDYSKNR